MTPQIDQLDDIQAPRPASTATGPFPYGWPGRVCYIEIGADPTPGQIRTRAGMVAAIARARAGESTIYAAWPGNHRTDLFVVDDLDALAARTADTRKR